MAVTLNANSSTGFIATSDTSGVLQLQTGGTTAVTVDASQNVGIGTSSPQSSLSVGGGVDVGQGITSGYAVLSFIDPSAGSARYASIRKNYDSPFDLRIRASNSSVGAPTIFEQSNSLEAMRITSAGNVGMGTTSPQAALDLGDGTAGRAITWGGSTGTARYTSIFSTYGSGSLAFGRGFTGSTLADSYVSTYTGTIANCGIRLDGNGFINFFTDASSSQTAGNAFTPTPRMRIDSSGFLMVNTTTLVSGFSAISTIVSATNTSSNITLKDTGTTYGTGTQYISFVNSSNAGAGSIQHTAVTTVAYATTSDLRLKENITDCPSALNIAQQIKVRSYNWKEDGRRVDYGFVAQELNPFFPDAVCQGDDSEEIVDPKQTWQVDYGKITPLLLKAIQEQQALITQLQADVAALKGASA